MVHSMTREDGSRVALGCMSGGTFGLAIVKALQATLRVVMHVYRQREMILNFTSSLGSKDHFGRLLLTLNKHQNEPLNSSQLEKWGIEPGRGLYLRAKLDFFKSPTKRGFFGCFVSIHFTSYVLIYQSKQTPKIKTQNLSLLSNFFLYTKPPLKIFQSPREGSILKSFNSNSWICIHCGMVSFPLGIPFHKRSL